MIFKQFEGEYIQSLADIQHRAMIDSDGYDKNKIKSLSFRINRIPEKLYKGTSNTTFVCIADNDCVGWASYNHEYSILDGVYVDPQYQGQQIGSKLIDRVESLAKDDNEYIFVYANPHLEDFYSDKGYDFLYTEYMESFSDPVKCLVMKKKI